jgi:hypothetical protein
VTALAERAAALAGSGCGLHVLEDTFRAALLHAGAAVLAGVLDSDDGYRGARAGCGRGHQAVFAGCRAKAVDTVVGRIEITRAWYHCAECHHGLAPRDGELGVPGSLSPGLDEMIALAGSEVSFARAALLIGKLAGIQLTVKRVERAAEAAGAAARRAAAAEAAALRSRALVPLPPPSPVPDMFYIEVDGTGIPVRPSETVGRRGKDGAAAARTREVKLARMFTVPGTDDDGRPVMDPGSSSYVHTFDGIAVFRGQVEAEAIRRGAACHRQQVVLGDGAKWIWAMADELYPDATQIVDLYHAREHLSDLAGHLEFITGGDGQWLHDRLADLDAGNIEAIIDAAQIYPLAGVIADDTQKELNYFRANTHRMRYRRFKALGMFIGSGAIESACKSIVAARAKQSGMHWTVDGADSIIMLRCQHASGRWDDLRTGHAQIPAAPAGLRPAI